MTTTKKSDTQPRGGRSRYSAPVVVDLGELTRSLGAACAPGSTPTSNCNPGAGLGSQNNCRDGGNATQNCRTGTGVV
jgi:hypothetical protein